MMPQGSGYHGICLTGPAPHPSQLLACWDATGAPSNDACTMMRALPTYLAASQNETSRPGCAGSCDETAGHHSSSCRCGPTPATPCPNTHTSHLSLFCSYLHRVQGSTLPPCSSTQLPDRPTPGPVPATGVWHLWHTRCTGAQATCHKQAPGPALQHQPTLPATQTTSATALQRPQHAAAAAAKSPRRTQPQGPAPSWQCQGAHPGENCLRAAATAKLASGLQHDSAQACSHGPIYPRPPANELLIDKHHTAHSQVQQSCTEQRCCDR